MALNLYNAVVMLDPLSADSVPVSHALLYALQQKFPIRMGLLPLVPAAFDRHLAGRKDEDVPSWGQLQDGEQFLRAFLMVKKGFNGAIRVRRRTFRGCVLRWSGTCQCCDASVTIVGVA